LKIHAALVPIRVGGAWGKIVDIGLALRIKLEIRNAVRASPAKTMNVLEQAMQAKNST
jgi:hypothetical protein